MNSEGQTPEEKEVGHAVSDSESNGGSSVENSTENADLVARAIQQLQANSFLDANDLLSQYGDVLPPELALAIKKKIKEAEALSEDITHPEYDFSVVSAIELMRTNAGLFKELTHLKLTLLLDAMAAFGEQEKDHSKEEKPKKKKKGERKISRTLYIESATPQIFKSIFYHFLHLNNVLRTSGGVESLKFLIELSSALWKKADRKPVMFFRRMIDFEHAMEKEGEYGRHTIDSTGGVYGEAIDLTNFEGSPGEFLRLGLAKGILELLHNQANLAGVEPLATQEMRNSRRNKRKEASQLLQIIETEGWDSLLDHPAPDLNSNSELRRATSDIKKHSHDITTELIEKTTPPERNLVKKAFNIAMGLIKARKSGKARFTELELAKKGLDAITVRLISKNGQQFVDLSAKYLLSYSGVEIHKMMASWHFQELKWQPIQEMDKVEDEANWPMFVLSASETAPNPYSADSDIYKYRGARGRAMLHLHVSEFKTADDKTKQVLYPWSGHWRLNGMTQDEFDQKIKKAILAETKEGAANRITVKPKEERELVPLDAFSIYPPLPSKDFEYKEKTPEAYEIDALLKGKYEEDPPDKELTRARLESLGLTDLELREEFDVREMQKNLDVINQYWNSPISNDLSNLIDFGYEPDVDQNVDDYQFKPPLGKMAFYLRYGIDERIALRYPHIARVEKGIENWNQRILPKITVLDQVALEQERAKIKKEIRNYLNPRISRLHIFSILAGLDGSAGYCVVPKPQEQNGLGIAFAGTVDAKVKSKIESYLERIRKNPASQIVKLGLSDDNAQGLLSVLFSTALDQTYTRLGIAPLAVLEDMTAEYPNLTELVADLIEPELKEKTYLVSQLSELPASDGLLEESESDWFNTALSGRRETMVRSWAFKGEKQAWRLHFGDPAFLEKVDFTNLSHTIIDETAEVFATFTQSNNQFDTLFPQLRKGLTIDAQSSKTFAMLAYRLFFVDAEFGGQNTGVSNAVRLDGFMRLVHGMSKAQFERVFPATVDLDISQIREYLLHGLKIITVAALRTKMTETNRLAVEFTKEVADVARYDNFVHFLHGWSSERFKERYPETQNMDGQEIRELYKEEYRNLASQKLLKIDPLFLPGLTEVQRHTLELAKLADERANSGKRLQLELALTIPIQKESTRQALIGIPQDIQEELVDPDGDK